MPEMTNIKPFPRITKQMALAIAQPIFNVDAGELKFHAAQPRRCALYMERPNVPCWWVIGPWSSKGFEYVLRSSRLVVISRVTGEIFYDGDAGDEG